MGRKEPPQYVTGGSLYMWRDFFPNAQIYGADFMGNALIQNDRIETIFCDERNTEDLKRVISHTGPDIDLFVDDANHWGCYQVQTCKVLMPLLNKEVIYIIEDVHYYNQVIRQISRFGYRCEAITQDNIGTMVVVRKP